MLLIAALTLTAQRQAPYHDYNPYYCVKTEPANTANLRGVQFGLTAAGLVGAGPFGPDIVGSFVENDELTVYDVKSYRMEQGFVWGGEAGGYIRLPSGERIELMVVFAKTQMAMVTNYIERQEGDSLVTYRQDSFTVIISDIIPRLRLSAAMPYGLEPYIGLGLATSSFEAEENYNVAGSFYDYRGGDFSADFNKTSKFYSTGLDLLFGLRVRITDNVACHLEADGVFIPNQAFKLDDVDNTIEPTDSLGNPRDSVTIELFPREHRLRLTHVTVRFGIEASFDVR